MRYVALLRAINVGGNRIVKMADLRQWMTDFGLHGISSYIQSGNLVFDSSETDAEALARRIETHLEANAGFAIPTTLRSPAQLAELVAVLPQPTADEKLNILFLGGPHAPQAAERLQALQQDGLQVLLRPRELVLCQRRDLVDKRLNSPNWIEKQLETWGTGRNQNTVNKLLQLAAAAD
ncbi:MAG: hypothetical protein CVV27_08380 [Candidatus Melainabacteria bacterium HGW-Melainabacteria-1]|nr:MAG: hypothetical protein CVV27_08380 [Candidatus Melainabacteria bacterium HGW-Melainabacteria-1]